MKINYAKKAEENGIPAGTYYARIKKGMTPAEAIFTPPLKRTFSLYELSYISRFYKLEGSKAVGAALGRHHQTIINKYNELKRNGELDDYRKMWEAIG